MYRCCDSQQFHLIVEDVDPGARSELGLSIAARRIILEHTPSIGFLFPSRVASSVSELLRHRDCIYVMMILSSSACLFDINIGVSLALFDVEGLRPGLFVHLFGLEAFETSVTLTARLQDSHECSLLDKFQIECDRPRVDLSATLGAVVDV